MPDDRLLRVTAVAGGRRSDLAVPGGVAVVDLVPDLARAVGLLDPAAVYAGYRLHAHGRRLRPDRGLREQGVEDGALLALTASADLPLPPAYDELAEATADLVERQRAWQPTDTRRTTLAVGLLALALGIGALGWGLVPRAPAGWAVALALVTLAGQALPGMAVAMGVARADAAPVDTDRVAAMVARSRRFLVAGSAAVGLVVVLAVPIVAHDVAGVALAADCCVVLLLRARRHRAVAPVLLDTAGGVTALLVIAAALLVRHPDVRPTTAAALVGTGLTMAALSRLPALPTALRARALDLLEVLALVALAPLLLVSTDGLAQVPGA